jgi:RimJ/RimL family protein N-acetyltransferase
MLDALASEERFRDRYGIDIGSHRAFASDVVRQTLDFEQRVRCDPPWAGYLAADAETGEAVVCCGFKGNPDDDNAVEIAYGTFPGHEGRGYATAAARALVQIARKDERVRRVLAHTLPGRNASCRILEKTGFEHLGEVIDPEDGAAWRWQLELTAYNPGP